MATALPDEQRVYGVARDITERKTAEKAFHQYQLRLKTLASQLTLTEEKERRRIAGDLHDKVSQSLALARLHIATFRRQATDPTQTEGKTDCQIQGVAGIGLAQMSSEPFALQVARYGRGERRRVDRHRVGLSV